MPCLQVLRDIRSIFGLITGFAKVADARDRSLGGTQ